MRYGFFTPGSFGANLTKGKRSRSGGCFEKIIHIEALHQDHRDDRHGSSDHEAWNAE